ncbi:MAG: hypothetical protein HFJ48_01425 [Clostridia bacterium]|nr:hypothetical protein [Clostridia bacterium]
MIVINKKRITAILTCILIGVFVFILETSDKENNVIETVTLPVSGKTIVIDARSWNPR